MLQSIPQLHNKFVFHIAHNLAFPIDSRFFVPIVLFVAILPSCQPSGSLSVTLEEPLSPSSASTHTKVVSIQPVLDLPVSSAVVQSPPQFTKDALVLPS